MKNILVSSLLGGLFIFMAGCQTVKSADKPTDNPYTHGNVVLNLEKDVTTQAEVLNVFGPPNIATTENGDEVWTYQKNATVSASKSSKGGIAVLLLGPPVGGAGFGGSSSSTRFEQSSKTMILIIKFDENKVVKDFSSRSTSF